MNEKKAIIIGGSDGIGAKCAELLKGTHKIINISRTSCPHADENIHLDIADGGVTEAVSSACCADVLLYSAGCSMAAPVEHIEEGDFRHLFEVNFFGFCEAVRAVLPSMREKGKGVICAIGSVGGVLPIAYDAYYSASKAALEIFTRELRLEVSPLGVRVICVLPGGTATNFSFKRKVYGKSGAGVYFSEEKRAFDALVRIEQGGMSPESVAAATVNAIIDGANRTIVPGAVNKAIKLSAKLMPQVLCDKLNARIYGVKQ